MRQPRRPHVLGIDDGPFDKFASPAPAASIIGVIMEGPDLVEAVAVTSFPVDGDGVTADEHSAPRSPRGTRAKSDLPEPLRLAHLIARAVTSGESRGRP